MLSVTELIFVPVKTSVPRNYSELHLSRMQVSLWGLQVTPSNTTWKAKVRRAAWNRLFMC
jgi:hypothetical protein